MLPQHDSQYLSDRGIQHSVTVESGMSCIVMPNFPLPAGFDRTQSDLLLRISPGYPDVPPDMWWFDPAVRSANGQPIPQTEVVEQYLGRQWQRWSRHIPQGLWNSGIDGLESFIALLRKDLSKYAMGSTP